LVFSGVKQLLPYSTAILHYFYAQIRLAATLTYVDMEIFIIFHSLNVTLFGCYPVIKQTLD